MFTESVMAAIIAGVTAVAVALISNRTRKDAKRANGADSAPLPVLDPVNSEWTRVVSKLIDRVLETEFEASQTRKRVGQLEKVVAAERRRSEAQDLTIKHQETVIQALVRLCRSLIDRVRKDDESEELIPDELRDYFDEH